MSDLRVAVALGLFVVLTALAYLTQPLRRAILSSVLGGWLFLPIANFGLPAVHGKLAVLGAIQLGAVLALAPRRWLRLRPSWSLLLVVAFCALPFATALANHLGAYEGFASVVDHLCTIGSFYLIGWLYFGDLRGLEQIARAVGVAGLVYLPFCLFEIRFSPQLHQWVYGYYQHEFGQMIRFDGYRPMVFMEHGLTVATFMASATLVVFCAWRRNPRGSLAGLPLGPAFLALFATSVLCKSVGALALLVIALAVLVVIGQIRAPSLLALFLIAAPVYEVIRSAGFAPADKLVEPVRQYIDADRAQSLGFRLWNENILVEKALQHPWLGWGRFGDARVYDATGRDVSTTDSGWTIHQGSSGALGLYATMLLFLLPALIFAVRVPVAQWGGVAWPCTAFAAVLALMMVNNVFNADWSPVYSLAAGSLAAIVESLRRRAPATRPIPVARARLVARNG